MENKELPKGWEWKKLDQLTECLDSKRIPITKNQREKGDVPYYGANGIQGYVKEFIFNEELLLIAEDGGSWGQGQKCTYIIKGKSWVNNHAHVLRMNHLILIKFLEAYLNKTDLNKYVSGTTRGKLNQKQMNNIEIPLPPIPIQQEIVSILEHAESLKQKRELANEEANKIIQSIFYDMFGDPIKNEKGWDVQNLEDVCEKLFAGGDVPKDNFSKEETDEFNVPIYSNGTADKALYGYTNIEKVQKDSVTISARGTIGSPVIRKAPFYPIIRLVVATPDTNKVNIFYFKEAVSFFKFDKGGTSIPQLPVPMVKKNKIAVPSIELQNQFAEIVQKIESIKQKQSKATEEINTLFDALMQKAFNGELTE